MTDQAKQKREELIDHLDKTEGLFKAMAYSQQKAFGDGFDYGYSTAMSEAQGLIDECEQMIGDLLAGIETRYAIREQDGSMGEGDHAVDLQFRLKQFRQEIEL